MKSQRYFVYIMTNVVKTTLYVGVTNDLSRRVYEHYNELFGGFTKQFRCKYLIYYEEYDNIEAAIYREKEIKRWRREKKNELISKFNSEWKFLNYKVNLK